MAQFQEIAIKNSNIRARKHFKHAWLMLLSVGIGWGAHAQTVAPAGQSQPSGTPADQLVEIVVTGTQIRGAGPVGSEVVAVTQEDMVNSGLTNTSDILHSVPQITNIGPGEGNTGSSANNAFLNTTGANAVNLRGLGSQATLTLFDGRRVAPGGEGAQLFDVSNIPAIALQRIDVEADGASATYGSDAIAGVVNLILRKDFTGFEADARYGFANGYDDKQVSLIGGQKWGDTSAMLAMMYQTHSGLAEGNRANLYNCNESVYGVPGAGNNCSTSASPGNVIDPATGKLYGLPPGPGTGLTPAALSATPNYEPGYSGNTAIPSLQRISIAGNVTQQLGSNISAWAEGYFSSRKYDYDFGNGLLNMNATTVPASNPNYITFPGSTAPEEVQAALGESARRGYERSAQLTLGLDAQIVSDWQAHVYGLYDIDSGLTENGSINVGLLQQANDGVGGTYFNPYSSSIPAADLRSFLGNAYQRSTYKIWLANAKVDGTLFDLPAGGVKLAVGGEYHSDIFDQSQVGDNSTASLGEFATEGSATASRKVASGFGEVYVPVVGGDTAVPAIQKLTVDIAGRYDHYSDVGSTTNPKLGLDWDVTQAFAIKATYGKSFRAPNLCDISPSCTAAVIGSPLPFGNVLMPLGGNSELTPEKATTYTIGGDWHPAFATGLDLGITYFHIDYKNLIGTPCAFNFGELQNPLYVFCVTAAPTQAQINTITGLPWYQGAPFPTTPAGVQYLLNGRRLNGGDIIDSGLDLSAFYRTKSDFGDWAVGARGTYQLDYDYQVVNGSPVIQDANTINYPLRFRGRAEADWLNHGFGVNLFVNYSSPYTDTTPPSPGVGVQHVASYTTIDLRLSYDTGDLADPFTRHIIVAVNATNLFNRAPPFVLAGTAQEYDSNVANQIGRMINFDIRKKF